MQERFTIKYRWAITISMLLASLVLLYFTFVYKLPYVRSINKDENPHVVAVGSMNNDIYSKISICDKTQDYPFVKTNNQNIFYSVKPYENVKLYEYSKGDFHKLSGVNEIKLSLTVNGEKIPFTIKYTVRDGKTVGYSIYQAKDKNKINKYAFARLCDMPKEMKTDYDLLLLIDLDYEDVFNSNKTYSEIYQLNSKTKKATRLVSESTRNISVKDGKLRNDHSIVTDFSVDQCRDRFFYLSGRNYKLDNEKHAYDIYSQYKYTKKPNLVAQNVLGEYVSQSQSGTCYLKNLDGNSFALVKSIDGDKEKKLKTFDRQLNKGYKQCGNYLLDYETMTLYDLKKNSEYTIFDTAFDSVKTFDVSPDGEKIVIYGSLSCNNERIVFFDLARKRKKCIDGMNLMHDDYPNLKFIDNDKISYIKPAKKDDKKLDNFVVSWNEIFAKMPDKQIKKTTKTTTTKPAN